MRKSIIGLTTPKEGCVLMNFLESLQPNKPLSIEQRFMLNGEYGANREFGISGNDFIKKKSFDKK